MSQADVDAKALSLAQWGGVDGALAQRLIGQVRALVDGGSLDGLNDVLLQVRA